MTEKSRLVENVKSWLSNFLNSELLKSIMSKYDLWKEGDEENAIPMSRKNKLFVLRGKSEPVVAPVDEDADDEEEEDDPIRDLEEEIGEGTGVEIPEEPEDLELRGVVLRHRPLPVAAESAL